MSEENKKIFENIEDEWVTVKEETLTVTIPETKWDISINPKELVKYQKYDIKIVLNYTLDSSSSFHLYFSEEIELKSLSIECDLKPSDNKYYGDTRLKISNNFIIKDLKAKELKLKNIEFNTKCDLFDIEVDKLIIDNCIFNDTFSITSYVENPIKRQFAKHILAKNIKFNSDLECAYNIFETLDISKSEIIGSANFKNCDFQEIQSKEERKKNKEKTFHDFSEVVFKENAYFDNSTFDDFTAFHLCVFEKTASFYRTKFNVIPNFSPGDFKGILNINNAKWGKNNKLEFEDVEKLVKEAYDNDNIEKNVINIKDSFRAIKNVLIQKNNLLEAQKFHKAELYCEELRIEQKVFKENKTENKTENKKVIFCLISKIFISFIFAISCILISIFIFVLFAVLIHLYQNSPNYIQYTMIDLKYLFYGILSVPSFLFTIYLKSLVKAFNSLDTESKYSEYKICVDYILLKTYSLTSDHHTNFLKIFNFTISIIVLFGISILLSYSPYFVNDYILPFIQIIDKKAIQDKIFFISDGIITSVSFVSILFVSMYIIIKNIYNDKNTSLNLFFILFMLIILVMAWLIIFNFNLSSISVPAFFLFFIILICIYKKPKRFLIACSYFAIILILAFSPQLINPFVGVFKSDSLIFKNYVDEKLNDLNASQIIDIALLLQNQEQIPVTINSTEIINARELIKKNLAKDMKDLNQAILYRNLELNSTIVSLKAKHIYQNVLESAIKSSSLVYSIILLLCLYSLTKTARKNSIVPI